MQQSHPKNKDNVGKIHPQTGKDFNLIDFPDIVNILGNVGGKGKIVDNNSLFSLKLLATRMPEKYPNTSPKTKPATERITSKTI